MKFYDLINKDTIAHEMDRICGTTNAKFPFQEKVARLNASLDRYFQLAWRGAGKRLLDDSNYSAAPIESQGITSGANTFKMGDFTNKIQQIIDVIALDSNGKQINLIPEYMDGLSETFDNLYVSSVASGVPAYYCIYGDYIYVRPNPNYTRANSLLVYGNRASSKYTYTRCTISQASPAVVTATAHGLAANDTVIFYSTGDDLPASLAIDTLYYVVATVATDTFSIASTQGGTAINTSDAGSGEHSFIEASKVPGIPPIYDHFRYLARAASLSYLIDKKLPQRYDYATLVKEDEKMIMAYFGNKERDISKKMTTKKILNR